MTEDDVHTAIVQWIAAETGLTTIRAHQGGKRPPRPYIMVNLTALREVREHPQDIEFTTTETLNSEGEFEVEAAPVIEIEWQFSLHSYGDAPTAPLRTIKQRRHVPQRQEPLHPALTVHDAGTVQSVPDFVNAAWEPRAQMPLFVRGLVRDGYVVDVVEVAPVDVSRI